MIFTSSMIKWVAPAVVARPRQRQMTIPTTYQNQKAGIFECSQYIWIETQSTQYRVGGSIDDFRCFV